MNIKQAKQGITQAVRVYFAKNEWGAYCIPSVRQRPILLMGPPGIGKTQIVQQVAHECGIGFLAYTMTHHTRQSALGLPMLKQAEFEGQQYTVTEYTMSEILAQIYAVIQRTGVREGILFLDEINCVSETLAPMMLELLQCKRFGSRELPAGWLIVAAGNPPEYNQSVREFDVVTLDRVRKMEITADYAVWREYALQRELHGAVLSYLELRREHFYQIELTAQGTEFVTARGWEDLSEWLTVCEQMGIEPESDTIKQYLQLEQIAKDFTHYLALYERYRKIYCVEDILKGEPQPLMLSELRQAAFDERLSVLGLLLAALNTLASQAWRADRVAVRLHEILLCVKAKQCEQGLLGVLQGNRQEAEQQLQELLRAQSTDATALWILPEVIAALRRLEQLAEQSGSFEQVKQEFQVIVAARTQTAERMGSALEHAFAFLESALGESHEMVLFASNLTAAFYPSWYLQVFGSEAYDRHNQALLFDDTHKQLMQEIDRVRREN